MSSDAGCVTWRHILTCSYLALCAFFYVSISQALHHHQVMRAPIQPQSNIHPRETPRPQPHVCRLPVSRRALREKYISSSLHTSAVRLQVSVSSVTETPHEWASPPAKTPGSSPIDRLFKKRARQYDSEFARPRANKTSL